jgi:hypothetical protein
MFFIGSSLTLRKALTFDFAQDRKKRIRSVVSKWNPQTGVRTDVPVNDTSLVEKDKGNVAFTFRRVLPLGSGQNPNDGFSEVDIESRELRDLLGEVIGEYTGQSWEGTIVNIRSPFAPLVRLSMPQPLCRRC